MALSFVTPGDKVRIYYEDDCFDEGEVTKVVANVVTVDFYDWIEEWPEYQFMIRDLFYEGHEVLIPQSRGTIIIDFRSAP